MEEGSGQHFLSLQYGHWCSGNPQLRPCRPLCPHREELPARWCRLMPLSLRTLPRRIPCGEVDPMFCYSFTSFFWLRAIVLNLEPHCSAVRRIPIWKISLAVCSCIARLVLNFFQWANFVGVVGVVGVKAASFRLHCKVLFTGDIERKPGWERDNEQTIMPDSWCNQSAKNDWKE